MAFDTRITYLCYNNRDLIRDGHIKTIIEKEYDPVDTFNINRLTNRPNGVTYIVNRDEDGVITSVKERKKQLPASKIKVEIDFSKVMKNAISHPYAPGSIAFTPIMGIIAPGLLSPLGEGGITSGLTYVTFHLLDAEVKINYRVKVDEEILNTGVLKFEGEYPLSVFGVVKEHLITTEEDEDKEGVSTGLNFSDEDLEILGKYSDGGWKGVERKRITGATNSDGLFGGLGDVEIQFEDVKYDNQTQLFVKIIKDERTLKFRGDNYDADGGKAYPFQLSGISRLDATDTQIRIDTTDLKEEDYIYITYSTATDRYVRQNLSHLGKVGQGNTIGLSGFVGAIGSEVDAWDYQLRTWKVPKSNLPIYQIDELSYDSDDDYKITLSNFLELKEKENRDEDISGSVDTIEGWRLSDAVTNGYIKKFWAADYRGILLYDNGQVTVMLEASGIRDQDWFNDYLEGLSFTVATGTDGVYLPDDLRKKIEEEIDLDSQPGFLFDISEITNTMLFDREKIPYYRPFAEALKNIRNYSSDYSDTGVGIMNLDIIEVAEKEGIINIDLEYYDLSYIDFENSNAQPVKSYSCEDPFEIHSYHYYSENYDAQNEGPGAWYDRGYIDNDVFGWRPSGSSIESYWKVETPYFCGKFTRKSRVYIEKMGGNSLDNFSWVYVDTEPFVPHNISLDTNHLISRSTIIFNDNNMHYSLCYTHLDNGYFEGQLPALTVDASKSHVMEEYNHDNSLIIGQNRLLGDSPSYNNGIPITDDTTRICKDNLDNQFWFTADLLNGTTLNGTSYEHSLNFSDDPPKAVIPHDWYIRQLTVRFAYTGVISSEVEKIISFYFEETESSISNYKIHAGGVGPDGKVTIIFDFNYYYGGPVQFLGSFWEKISVEFVTARVTSPSVPINTTRLELTDYKVDSVQSSTVYDGMGRLMVFYSNSSTGNLDMALSIDDGDEWVIHKNLIRLIEGEFASMPFAIKDIDANYLHLFYVLNDAFLMYKRINTNLFKYDDAFVEYTIPTAYDVGDYNQELDDPERTYWGDYSEEGTLLRRFPSYFIAGSHDDTYFIDQTLIASNLRAANESINVVKKRQTPRFEFVGNTANMVDAFKGEAYSIYIGDEGVLRLFMISDGKISVKRSSDYFTWEYDVFEQIIHKNYLDEKLNRGLSEEIQNIQVVKDEYSAAIASVLYFNNGMLFIRHFYSSLLFPWYDSEGNKHDEQMVRHLELTSESGNRPIFLVGNIPARIKQILTEEMDGGVSAEDSKLLIQFPYDRDMIEKFDDRFAVDSDTQTYAYVTTKGLIRVLYKDSFGNLDGIIIDSLNDPTLEVLNKL